VVVKQRKRSLKIPEISAMALNNVQPEKGSDKDNNSTLVNICCAASTPTGDSNLEVAGSETSVCDISRNKYGRRSVETDKRQRVDLAEYVAETRCADDASLSIAEAIKSSLLSTTLPASHSCNPTNDASAVAGISNFAIRKAFDKQSGPYGTK
jgi:hypothetical protein